MLGEADQFMINLIDSYEDTYLKLFKEIQKEDIILFISMELSKKNSTELMNTYYDDVNVLKKFSMSFSELKSSVKKNPENKWFTTKTYCYTAHKIGNSVENNIHSNVWNNEENKFISHMRIQFLVAKCIIIKNINNLIEKNTLYANFTPSFDDINSTKFIAPIKTQYIYPFIITNYHDHNYPPLYYSPQLFNQWKNTEICEKVMALQRSKMGMIVGEYILISNSIMISFYLKLNNRKEKILFLMQSIEINKYIYNDRDAIFWNWYGGNIPIDNDTREALVHDTGLNIFGIGWINYSNVPIMKNVTGIVHMSIDQINSKIYKFNNLTIEKLIEKNRSKYSLAIINSIELYSDVSVIGSLLNTFTEKYNTICDVLKLRGIDPNKIFCDEQFYSKKHIIKYRGLYNEKRISFDKLYERIFLQKH